MKRRMSILFGIYALIAICTFAVAAPKETARRDSDVARLNIYSQLELFADAVSIIRNDYTDVVDSKKLVYGALKGMLSSLDDFSQFMEPDEYSQIQEETKGEFGGLGIEVSNKDGVLTVIAPIAATPAEAVGIKAGDKIIKIDDKETEKISLSDAVKLMKGQPGTSVTLTVWREKEQKVLDFTIKRAIIKVASVKKAALFKDNIGYIQIAEFQDNTPRDLDEALKKLDAEGMDSLILDLRNNPGGLLEVAVDVAEKFLPKDKVIVSIKSRAKGQNAIFKSTGKYFKGDYPLIVMVNEGSASASEIVAGAMQDNKRGILLGTTTFGKASVQTVIPLADKSALRLTTASYYTPSGRMIRKEGIRPDVVVEEAIYEPKKRSTSKEIFAKLDAKKPEAMLMDESLSDNQLQSAMSIIKGIRAYRSMVKGQ